ncbi:hypothetical protein [Streptomyces sp. NPDC051310]|uniref:hypothetical protein n=1 Tax=Streptomyces sp. NPDC051310 TaxID=3365649 RepID=UPI0037894869
MKRTAGQWPITEPVSLPEDEDQGAAHLALVAEQARFHVTLGSVRADLEEQPSPMCVRAAARRWCEAITAMAEDVARGMRDTA